MSIVETWISTEDLAAAATLDHRHHFTLTSRQSNHDTHHTTRHTRSFGKEDHLALTAKSTAALAQTEATCLPNGVILRDMDQTEGILTGQRILSQDHDAILHNITTITNVATLLSTNIGQGTGTEIATFQKRTTETVTTGTETLTRTDDPATIALMSVLMNVLRIAPRIGS